jgi:hypothetical protein
MQRVGNTAWREAREAGQSADSRQARVIAVLLEGRNTAAIEDVGMHFIMRSAESLDYAPGHGLPGHPSSPGQMLAPPTRSEEAPLTSVSSVGRAGEPSLGTRFGVRAIEPGAPAKVGGRPGSVGAALVAPLHRIFRTRSVRPGPEVAERLTDTRRLLQIGLVLGMAYVAFLTFWFWGTRGRGRRARGGFRS